MAVTVGSLHVYPVKACRGVGVDRLTIGPTGPIGDRCWQVVDDEGRPLTQRAAPRLATVEVEMGEVETGVGGLRLEAAGHGAVEVAVPGPDPPVVEVESWVAPLVVAADGGDEAARWLAGLLGRPARLVGMTATTDIRLPEPIELWGHGISFVDAAPVLVANRASCDWLVARASEPFGIDRFRANVVVSGAEPWAEDTWARFTCDAGPVGGEIAVGDELTVTATREPVLPPPG